MVLSCVMCGVAVGCRGRQCVRMGWGTVCGIWWWVFYQGVEQSVVNYHASASSCDGEHVYVPSV